MTTTQKQRLPDVRLDRCKFGINGTLGPANAFTRQSLEGDLSALVPITTPISKESPTYFQLTVPLFSPNDAMVGDVRVDLHFAQSNGLLILTDRSSAEVNPQKIARKLLGGEAECGPPGFGGATNVLALQHRGPAILALLIEIAVDAVGEVLSLISRVAPEWQPGEMWLKAVEVCRDLPSEDAIAAMQPIQHAAVAGATSAIRNLYFAEASDEGDTPTARWMQFANGPVHKVYAKRRDTLRIELACPAREALSKLMKRERVPLSEKGAERLLRNFALAATPSIDRLNEHVVEVLDGWSSTIPLMMALAPLALLASGQSTRGPAPLESTRQAAEDALGRLLAAGMYNANGIVVRHAVRKALDGLAARGILVRTRRHSIYCLHPTFGPAAAVLADRAGRAGI